MFLFENNWLVVGLGLSLVFAFLARRLISGNPAQNKSLGIAAIFTIGLVAVNWMVITPREQISDICRELARFVDEGDVAQIGKRLAPDFTAGGMDREVFLERVSTTLTRTRLDHVRLRGINVMMETSANAIAEFTARCNIRTAEGFAGFVPTRWRLRFVDKDGEWVLKEVESIPIPPLNLQNPLRN